MFGLFKTSDLDHPQLGVLGWRRGCWRGEISLSPYGRVPLVLGGTRKGPDAQALSQALTLAENFAAVRHSLQQALFEHYEPYAEAVRAGELRPDDDGLAELSDPAEALRKASLVAVVVVPLDDEMATELCYEVPWDREHLLGACFRGRQWIELCGSTLLP
ncbi:DUF6985 domain-containing protein [Roseateles cavernae]|uniref:DUF6985 domain-containing protein n=1 Tax=Roseateles cavernae TaxID=3153578 RepID=UPI0032E51207